MVLYQDPNNCTFQRCKGCDFHRNCFQFPLSSVAEKKSMFYVKKVSELVFFHCKKVVDEMKHSEKQLFPVLALRVPVQSYCPLPIASKKASPSQLFHAGS